MNIDTHRKYLTKTDPLTHSSRRPKTIKGISLLFCVGGGGRGRGKVEGKEERRSGSSDNIFPSNFVLASPLHLE